MVHCTQYYVVLTCEEKRMYATTEDIVDIWAREGLPAPKMQIPRSVPGTDVVPQPYPDVPTTSIDYARDGMETPNLTKR
jgi:hypothetical protein